MGAIKTGSQSRSSSLVRTVLSPPAPASPGERSMPYIVDGNNVMAQTVGWHRDKAAARRLLIHDLVRFVTVKKVKLKVVFDGAPDEEFPEGRKFKGVHILYARPGSDADSRIKELVKKASYKRDLVAVTSDRALASFVQHQGARVMSSGEFRRLLEECLKQVGSMDKSGQGDRVDIEEWLEFFKQPGG
jgi:predicted RNA-binding protein with PIN domain